MYTITFSLKTLQDLRDHRYDGRQFYAAVLMPDSGIFTSPSYGDGNAPKIICPYQVNDIIAIQEKWARTSTSYVYKTDGATGYNYRPATTMPLDATRMWGRIVSITPWIVTQEIIDKYLSYGVSSDSYDGAATVVDYYDTGTKLLSNVRKLHNQSALSKMRQPQISSDPPKITKSIYYHLHQSFTYYCSPREMQEMPYYGTSPGPTSPYAIARALPDTSDGTVRDYVLLGENESVLDDPPPRGVPIDRNNGSWAFSSTFNQKTGTDLTNYTYIGLDKRSRPGRLRYVYLYKMQDSSGNDVYVPNFATYQAEIIDPTFSLYAWLISGYLCSRDGEILGSYF